MVRRTSTGGDAVVVLPVLRPSHSEPLIPADGVSPRHLQPGSSAARRRVARDPSANPSPPVARRSSSSSPGGEPGQSPTVVRTSTTTRGGPAPRPQRQPAPPLALPPPAGGRRAGPAVRSSQNTGPTGRTATRQQQRAAGILNDDCDACYTTVLWAKGNRARASRADCALQMCCRRLR